MSHSLGDMGQFAPLYYVAVKCRVHRLRMHANRLIEEGPRKEGIYDAILIANIARKIMRVEEVDSLEADTTEDEFQMSDPPLAEDVLLGTLPQESHRVQILDVLLPDAPWISATLRYKYQDTITSYKLGQQLLADGKRSGQHSTLKSTLS